MNRMKPPKELEALAKNPNYKMTADEARLYDLLTFRKTGKHTDRFKGKGKPKPKPKGPVLKQDLKAAPKSAVWREIPSYGNKSGTIGPTRTSPKVS